jgi:hypothetical protein
MGGYVDRLRAKLPQTGAPNPLGDGENNFDSSTKIAKLFGPIEILIQ